ncbi:MAG: ABC transporter ATP-binding protein [bacterium]|nr:ABC transporter ATP-binding protein [bacterium]
MTAIKTDNLTKIFPNNRGIRDLSIEVEEAEVLSFLGVNGAGKTTTVRMLAGMIMPTSGSAEVFGADISKNPAAIHETVGLLTETPGFYEKMSLEANLRFFAGFYKKTNVESQVNKYLELFDLQERRKENVSSLSKGLKQRLAICRAMVHEPKILFFDEPTSGLDPESALNIKKIIKKLKEEGRTIILCTHNLTEADELSDRIAIINGKLLEMQTPSQLKKKYFRRVLILKTKDTIEKVKSVLSQNKIGVSNGDIEIEAEDDEIKSEMIKKLVGASIDVQEIFEKSASLEEAYMKVMAEGRNNE